MLELIPKDSTVLERGAYLFEIAPDGVSVKLKKAEHRLAGAQGSDQRADRQAIKGR